MKSLELKVSVPARRAAGSPIHSQFRDAGNASPGSRQALTYPTWTQMPGCLMLKETWCCTCSNLSRVSSRPIRFCSVVAKMSVRVWRFLSFSRDCNCSLLSISSHSPDLHILHNEIFLRGEGRTAEGGAGKAGAAVQISVQPQAESTPVDPETQ